MTVGLSQTAEQGEGGGLTPPRFDDGGLECPSAPPPGSGRDAPRPPSSMPHLHWDQYIESIPPPPPGNFLPPPLAIYIPGGTFDEFTGPSYRSV